MPFRHVVKGSEAPDDGTQDSGSFQIKAILGRGKEKPQSQKAADICATLYTVSLW